MYYARQNFEDGKVLTAKQLNSMDKALNQGLPGSHWYGKKWYAYGTSLTAKGSGQYADFVADALGLTLVNKGIGGAAVSQNKNLLKAVTNITDGKLEADLITLEVGANDINALIGDIYDTDSSTFCGGVNQCIRYLQENTKAQIVVISSTASRYRASTGELFVPDFTWASDKHTQYDQWKAIEEICKLNSCYYIPLGETCNLGPTRGNSDIGNNYFKDTVHHTELGGFILSQFIVSRLKDIPLWYNEMPNLDPEDTPTGDTFTVYYNINVYGENVPPSVPGINRIPNPLPQMTSTDSSKVFKGWYYDMEGTHAAVPGEAITSDVVLYAVWMDVSEITITNYFNPDDPDINETEYMDPNGEMVSGSGTLGWSGYIACSPGETYYAYYNKDGVYTKYPANMVTFFNSSKERVSGIKAENYLVPEGAAYFRAPFSIARRYNDFMFIKSPDVPTYFVPYNA
jgi:lysophospholipase L1-like esterase